MIKTYCDCCNKRIIKENDFRNSETFRNFKKSDQWRLDFVDFAARQCIDDMCANCGEVLAELMIEAQEEADRFAEQRLKIYQKLLKCNTSAT